MEVEALGLTATCHPFDLWVEAAKSAGAIPTTELKAKAGRKVKVAGWIVTDRRVRIRGKQGRGARGRGTQIGKAQAGRYMKFLMLEDHHGTVEVTLFPEAYARCGHRLTNAGPYLVSGIVRVDHGALTLDARDIRHLATTEGTLST